MIIKFWSDLKQKSSLNPEDKILIGNETTRGLNYTSVSDIQNFISEEINSKEALSFYPLAQSATVLPVPPTVGNIPMTRAWTWLTQGVTYTQAGGPALAAPLKRQSRADWDGASWSLKDMGALPSIAIADKVTKGDTTGISGNAVYQYINGGVQTYGASKILTQYATNPTSSDTVATYVFSSVYPVEVQMTEFTYYGVVAGPVLLCTFSRVGDVVTRQNFLEISVLTGLNTISIPVNALVMPVDGMFGMTIGSNYTGRIGWLSTAPDADYYAYIGGSSIPFALPATPASVGGFGIKFSYAQTEPIANKISTLETKVSDITIVTYDAGWGTQIGDLKPDYTSNPGYITLALTTGAQSIKLADVLPNQEKKYVRFRAKTLNNTTANLVVGQFTSTITGTTTYAFEVTSTEQEFEFEIEGNADNSIAFGILAANNTGQIIAFKDFEVFSADGVEGLGRRVAVLEDEMQAIKGAVYNSGWVTQIGSLSPNYNSNTGYITLNFTSGNNQSIKLPNVLPNEAKAFVKFKAKTLGGNASLVVGKFVTIVVNPATHAFEVTPTEQEFEFEIEGNTDNSIAFGILAANNTGQAVVFKDFTIFSETSIDGLSERIAALEKSGGGVQSSPRSFNLENIFFSLSRYDKPLTIIGCLGDSLLGNPTGGPIPNIESITQRPLRLGESNTLARRLYDHLSWNKPNWCRLDDAVWSKTGTWTTLNDTSLFEPTYTSELYHKTSVTSSDASITIPSGSENFALVCRKGVTSGVIEIYLNDILHTTFDTLKASAGHTGNPYQVVQILNMPTGQSNTIRVVNKATNTNPIYVWGGFYWTGNTLVVMNVAHGGHTLQDLLTQHIDDEVVDNNFDAILFEHTLMNDTARSTISGSVAALKNILDNKVKGKEMLMMSCHPFGTDPRTGTPNYYTQYPGMEEMKDALKKVAYDKGLPYLDIFDVFKNKIQNRGGTLIGGQGGIWYTWDGQHQNEPGMREFWNLLKSVLIDNPLKLG